MRRLSVEAAICHGISICLFKPQSEQSSEFIHFFLKVTKKLMYFLDEGAIVRRPLCYSLFCYVCTQDYFLVGGWGDRWSYYFPSSFSLFWKKSEIWLARSQSWMGYRVSGLWLFFIGSHLCPTVWHHMLTPLHSERLAFIGPMVFMLCEGGWQASLGWPRLAENLEIKSVCYFCSPISWIEQPFAEPLPARVCSCILFRNPIVWWLLKNLELSWAL